MFAKPADLRSLMPPQPLPVTPSYRHARTCSGHLPPPLPLLHAHIPFRPVSGAPAGPAVSLSLSPDPLFVTPASEPGSIPDSRHRRSRWRAGSTAETAARTKAGPRIKSGATVGGYAPISGIVLEPGSKSAQKSGEDGDGRPLAVGRPVNQGGYLLSIAELETISVAGGVDEVDVVKVKPDQRVRIGGDAFPDLVFQGRIARVSPQSRSKGRSRVPIFDVTAVIDRLTDEHLAQLRLGMSANVTIVVRDEPDALLVPLAAVKGSPGNYRVRVMDKEGGAPREVRVQAGETTLYEVEIVGGLKAGDEVIVAGS